MKVKTKEDVRIRIKARIRKKLSGSTQRPRLAVFRSQSHIYAQVIDDDAGQTLCAPAEAADGFANALWQTRAADARVIALAIRLATVPAGRLLSAVSG